MENQNVFLRRIKVTLPVWNTSENACAEFLFQSVRALGAFVDKLAYGFYGRGAPRKITFSPRAQPREGWHRQRCTAQAFVLPACGYGSIILHSVTSCYPTCWGVGLVVSLLRPGKPADKVTSLRGIRLLSRFAAWFGQVLGQRLRWMWNSGPKQFGLKPDDAWRRLPYSLLYFMPRSHRAARSYVIFVDLRTAFPSLNLAILIRRMVASGYLMGCAV